MVPGTVYPSFASPVAKYISPDWQGHMLRDFDPMKQRTGFSMPATFSQIPLNRHD